jgi:hypothetical protein
MMAGGHAPNINSRGEFLAHGFRRLRGFNASSQGEERFFIL